MVTAFLVFTIEISYEILHANCCSVRHVLVVLVEV